MEYQINITMHLTSINEIENFLNHDADDFHLKISSKKERYISFD